LVNCRLELSLHAHTLKTSLSFGRSLCRGVDVSERAADSGRENETHKRGCDRRQWLIFKNHYGRLSSISNKSINALSRSGSTA
jgi:hypothetical protein